MHFRTVIIPPSFIRSMYYFFCTFLKLSDPNDIDIYWVITVLIMLNVIILSLIIGTEPYIYILFFTRPQNSALYCKNNKREILDVGHVWGRNKKCNLNKCSRVYSSEIFRDLSTHIKNVVFSNDLIGKFYKFKILNKGRKS